jgi:antitoxin VapB
MTTAKVFKSGNSQALRIPKEFALKGPEVDIFRRGDELVVREKAAGMARAFELLAGMPDDFFPEGRSDPPPQKRQGL